MYIYIYIYIYIVVYWDKLTSLINPQIPLCGLERRGEREREREIERDFF